MFLILKNNFENFYFFTTWIATWQKLYNQQLPYELKLADSAESWSKTFLKNRKFYKGLIFFGRTKTKTHLSAQKHI